MLPFSFSFPQSKHLSPLTGLLRGPSPLPHRTYLSQKVLDPVVKPFRYQRGKTKAQPYGVRPVRASERKDSGPYHPVTSLGPRGRQKRV